MNVVIERQGRVVLVRLNRPQVKNALNSALMTELVSCLEALDQDPQVGCLSSPAVRSILPPEPISRR